jgi:hypothetical protein
MEAADREMNDREATYGAAEGLANECESDAGEARDREDAAGAPRRELIPGTLKAGAAVTERRKLRIGLARTSGEVAGSCRASAMSAAEACGAV